MEHLHRKKTEEALSEIYRNAQLALVSIADILPEVGEDEQIKTELHTQHEEYEKYSAKASVLARNMGLELKEPSPFKKVMMWGSIKMSAMKDNSRAHIAEMMIKGTVMGITSLKTTQSELPIEPDKEIETLLQELVALEERYEKRLKEFL